MGHPVLKTLKIIKLPATDFNAQVKQLRHLTLKLVINVIWFFNAALLL